MFYVSTIKTKLPKRLKNLKSINGLIETRVPKRYLGNTQEALLAAKCSLDLEWEDKILLGEALTRFMEPRLKLVEISVSTTKLSLEEYLQELKNLGLDLSEVLYRLRQYGLAKRIPALNEYNSCYGESWEVSSLLEKELEKFPVPDRGDLWNQFLGVEYV